MSDIVERIRKLRYVHVPVASQLMAETVAEIDRLRNIVAKYTDGILAVAESNRSHAQSDEKHGVADTNRASLTDAEREAISFFAAIHNEGYGLFATHTDTLRKLLEKSK